MAFLRGYVVKIQTALLGVKKGQKWPKMATNGKKISAVLHASLMRFVSSKLFMGLGRNVNFAEKCKYWDFNFKVITSDKSLAILNLSGQLQKCKF